jgi:ferrochelatase
MQKKAVILFNLGGPDSQEAVKPFLFNLFNDKAIISAPNPIRYFLAKFISSKREKTAQEIYSHIGGKSTINDETIAQKDALEKILNDKGSDAYKVFICMRYWHPFADKVVLDVKDYNPDEIILLPLYPQLSTSTSQSSIDDWNKNTKKIYLDKPI